MTIPGGLFDELDRIAGAPPQNPVMAELDAIAAAPPPAVARGPLFVPPSPVAFAPADASAARGPVNAPSALTPMQLAGDAGAQMLRGLAESGYGTVQGAANLAERTGLGALEDRTIRALPLLAPVRALGQSAGAIRESRGEMRETYGDPKSALGTVAGFGGGLLGSAAQFAAPGAALGGLTGQALGLGGRVLAGTAVATPLNLAISQSPEDATATFIADLLDERNRLESRIAGAEGILGSPSHSAYAKQAAQRELEEAQGALAGLSDEPSLMRRLANSPTGAFAVETGVDLLGGGIIEAATEALRVAKARGSARRVRSPNADPMIPETLASPAPAAPRTREQELERAVRQLDQQIRTSTAREGMDPAARQAELEAWQRQNRPELLSREERRARLERAKPQEPQLWPTAVAPDAPRATEVPFTRPEPRVEPQLPPAAVTPPTPEPARAPAAREWDWDADETQPTDDWKLQKAEDIKTEAAALRFPGEEADATVADLLGLVAYRVERGESVGDALQGVVLDDAARDASFSLEDAEKALRILRGDEQTSAPQSGGVSRGAQPPAKPPTQPPQAPPAPQGGSDAAVQRMRAQLQRAASANMSPDGPSPVTELLDRVDEIVGMGWQRRGALTPIDEAFRRASNGFDQETIAKAREAFDYFRTGDDEFDRQRAAAKVAPPEAPAKGKQPPVDEEVIRSTGPAPVTPGKVRTASGREIDPPKQVGSAGNKIRIVDTWLHEQAMLETQGGDALGSAAARTADFRRTQVEQMLDPKTKKLRKLSQGDRDTLNEIVFGNADGVPLPAPAPKVAKGKKKPVEPEPTPEERQARVTKAQRERKEQMQQETAALAAKLDAVPDDELFRDWSGVYGLNGPNKGDGPMRPFRDVSSESGVSPALDDYINARENAVYERAGMPERVRDRNMESGSIADAQARATDFFLSGGMGTRFQKPRVRFALLKLAGGATDAELREVVDYAIRTVGNNAERAYTEAGERVVLGPLRVIDNVEYDVKKKKGDQVLVMRTYQPDGDYKNKRVIGQDIPVSPNDLVARARELYGIPQKGGATPPPAGPAPKGGERIAPKFNAFGHQLVVTPSTRVPGQYQGTVLNQRGGPMEHITDDSIEAISRRMAERGFVLERAPADVPEDILDELSTLDDMARSGDEPLSKRELARYAELMRKVQQAQSGEAPTSASAAQKRKRWPERDWEELTPEQLTDRLNAMDEQIAWSKKKGMRNRELEADAKELDAYATERWKQAQNERVETDDAPAPARVELEADKTDRRTVGATKGTARDFGRELTITLSDGTKVRAKYAVLEADSMRSSHKPHSFEPDPLYPAKIQGRDYLRDKAAQETVKQRAAQFDPDRALDPSISAEKGPPILTTDGLVIAGNERSMLLRLAPREKMSTYRNQLVQRAREFGLDPAVVSRKSNPVLVRIIDDPAVDQASVPKLQELNRLSDTPDTKTKSGSDDAASRADVLRSAEDALNHYASTIEGDETLAAYLSSARGKTFVQKLREDGVIAQQELARYLDAKTGALTDEGKTLIERMMLAAAVENPKTLSSVPAGILAKIEHAVPHIVLTRSSDEWDIAAQLQGALDLHTRARQNGLSIDELAGQGSMFGGDDVDPKALRMARFLENKKKAEVTAAFRKYATVAREAEGRAQSVDMFGGAPTRADAEGYFADPGPRRRGKKEEELSLFVDNTQADIFGRVPSLSESDVGRRGAARAPAATIEEAPGGGRETRLMRPISAEEMAARRDELGNERTEIPGADDPGQGAFLDPGARRRPADYSDEEWGVFVEDLEGIADLIGGAGGRAGRLSYELIDEINRFADFARGEQKGMDLWVSLRDWETEPKSTPSQMRNLRAVLQEAGIGPVKVTKETTGKREFKVTIRKANPSWDEVDGLPFTVNAESKADAIKKVRARATNEGHIGYGQGRYSISAEEIGAAREDEFFGDAPGRMDAPANAAPASNRLTGQFSGAMPAKRSRNVTPERELQAELLSSALGGVAGASFYDNDRTTGFLVGVGAGWGAAKLSIAGIRGAAKRAALEEGAKSLRRINLDLMRAVGITSREGRSSSLRRSARAWFRADTEAIRQQRLDHLDSGAHEVGHFVSKRLLGNPGARKSWGKLSGPKMGMNKAELAELVEHGKNLYGNRKPTAGYAEEGIAEFFKFYVTDPQKATTQFPLTAQKMLAALDAPLVEGGPTVRQAVDDARDQFARYKSSSAYEQVSALVSVDEQALTRPTLDDYRRLMENDLIDIQTAERQMLELGAQVGRSEVSPHTAMLLTRGTAGEASRALDDGIVINGQKVAGGVAATLKAVGSRMQDFRLYLIAKRTLEDLAPRGIDSGVSPAQARALVEQLEPEFKKHAEVLYEFSKARLRLLQMAGLLDGKQVATIIEKNPHYISFSRVFDGEELDMGRGVGKAKGKTSAGVMRIKGSSRRIIDPIEAFVRDTYDVYRRVREHLAATQFLRMALETEGGARWVEVVETPKIGQRMMLTGDVLEQLQLKGIIDEDQLDELRMQLNMGNLEGVLEGFTYATQQGFGDPKDLVFPVRMGNELKFVQVKDKKIYETLLGMNREEMSSVERFIKSWPKWAQAPFMPAQAVARTLRAGATLTTEFIARNPVRDAWGAMVRTRAGRFVAPGEHLIRGVASLIKQDGAYDAWLRSGGANATMVSGDRSVYQKSLRDLQATAAQKGWYLITHPVDFLRAVSEVSENATRLGEFKLVQKRELKRGATPRRANLEGAAASRDITVDFAKAGQAVRQANKIVAFLNAYVQGQVNLLRDFKNRPGEVIPRILVGITLPSIALELIYADNEAYQEVPEWVRRTAWVIPMGDGPTAKYIAIPKPFELGTLFGTIPQEIVRAFLQTKAGRDPRAAERILSHLGQAVKPPMLPTFAAPLVENYANKSTFTGRPIVPRDKEGELPGQQASPRTGELARLLGQSIGYAPAKIENTVRGYTGGLGQYAMEAGDAVVRATREKAGMTPLRPVRPPDREGLPAVPAVRAFVKAAPGLSSESLERFYRDRDESERYRQTYQSKRENDPKGAVAFFEKHKALILGMSSQNEAGQGPLREAERDINQLREERRTVVETMTGARRRTMLEKIDNAIVARARQANLQYERLRQQQRRAP